MIRAEKELKALQDNYLELREEVNTLNAEYLKISRTVFNYRGEPKTEAILDRMEIDNNITKIKLHAVLNYIRDRDFGIDPDLDIDQYLDEALNDCDKDLEDL